MKPTTLTVQLTMTHVSLVFLLLLGSFAFAQPYYRGDVEFTVSTSGAAFTAPTGLALAGHLEVGYDLELHAVSPIALSLVLDPSVRLSQVVTAEPGLTELYAATTYGDLELSAGVERLPLETARLSVPYSVERVDFRGLRHGAAGVRGVLYSGDWRLRGAVFYGDGRAFTEVIPLVSVRKTFDSFDLEAHLLYQNGFVGGLGGSGLVEGVVVYGEAWLLSEAGLRDFSGRGAVGLNGNLPNGTWTLEAAYLAPDSTSLKDDLAPTLAPAQPSAERSAAVNLRVNPRISPHPAVLGQLVLPLGDADGMSLALTGNAFFDPDAVRGGIGASYTLFADAELTLGAATRFGPEPVATTLTLSLRGFF